ncbi:MAG TPA: alginate export family protein [Thermoanaerobaculia bacterium]|nr:alginate export family protein [Thermoanaerobaculia bacterium]
MKSFLTVVLLVASPLIAADVQFTGSIRARAENWRFFETPNRDDQYRFFAYLLRVSAAQQRKGWAWQFEVAQPTLVGLPSNAIAPAPQGQLGIGASYFAANGDSDVAGIFFRQAFVDLKRPSDSFRFGRFEFIEGSEALPKNPMLAAIRQQRVAHRLIGNFAFSHVQRTADGVQYTHTSPTTTWMAAAFRPTVGSLRVHGGDNLDIGVAYGSMTRAMPNADARLFVILYRDHRDVLKTDNRPAAVRRADTDDIAISTVGGHWLAAHGNSEVLVWGALQGGRWGSDDHKAAELDLEGGYHWPTPKKPVLRAGLFVSSGDDDPNDGDHETFFQMLPTPRIYARFPFYNAMNSTDSFVQFSIKPTAKVTLGAEAHTLRLSEKNDLWYSGGGAFEDNSFGFAGRPSGGSDELARTIDLSADYAPNPKTTMILYAGIARGGDVVRSIFAGRSGRLIYFEVTRKF